MLFFLLIYLAAIVGLGLLIMYFRYLYSGWRGLAMANYLYPRAAYIATATSIVGAGHLVKYKEEMAWPSVIITGSWVITEVPGLLQYAQASFRDENTSFCRLHFGESVLGEGWYKGTTPSYFGPGPLGKHLWELEVV